MFSLNGGVGRNAGAACIRWHYFVFLALLQLEFPYCACAQHNSAMKARMRARVQVCVCVGGGGGTCPIFCEFFEQHHFEFLDRWFIKHELHPLDQLQTHFVARLIHIAG